MNVGIDLERLRNVNSGLGQFCLHLANGLLVQKRADISLHYYMPANTDVSFATTQHTVGLLDKFRGVKNRSLDVFHCTHQDSHLFPKTIPTVLTIHDLNFLEKYSSAAKQQARLKALQKKVDKAKGIVFISNYTKELVKTHIRLPQVPCNVIYNGNCLQQPAEAIKPKGLPDGEFMFAIGIVNPKKNFHVLLPLVQKTGLPLVIAGNNTHSYANEILENASRMGISDKVHLTGPVSEAEKYWLYSHCKAFVFPSLAEGFGLPVVEAMSLGKPVFLSDKGSLPEIGGSLAFYWHTFDTSDMYDVWLQGLHTMETDTQRSQELKKHAAQFSWEKAAADYLDFYSEVYKQA